MAVRIGIDIGSSTTKIVAFEGEHMLPPMAVKADSQVASLYGAFGRYLYENNLQLLDVEGVYITGVGSKYVEKAVYDRPTYKVDEFVATGTGGYYLTDKKEVIVISMGTGSFFVKVTENEMKHLGGVGLGGGTICGLSSIILNTGDVVVHGAQGIADAALNMCAFLVGRLDGGLQVAGVVQCVEDADDVDAVCNGLLHEVLDGVVSIGAVAQHVLAAEQHLQLLVGQLLAQDAQTLPGVLIEEADAAIKGSAAPALDREVRDLIHFGQDGTHLIHRHTGGQQRLVSITQDDFRNLDRLFGHGCHLFLSSQFMETRTSPELTVSPLLTLTEATVPS